MFEAVELIERPNQPDPVENALGEFDEELDAVDAAREARKAFMDKGSKEYAWWVVRKPGAPLASSSPTPRVTRSSSLTSLQAS